MKNTIRWGLIVAGIAAVAFIVDRLFFHFWSLYPIWGWRHHYFGPRIWPAFPFVGLLILFMAGILIAKCFFQALRDSSMLRRDELAFCPYCGKDLRKEKAISEIKAEKL